MMKGENLFCVRKMPSTNLRCSIAVLLFVLLQILNIYGLNHGPEYRAPLAVVSDISSRLAAHSARAVNEPRLPLPTPQDLEAIKKIAQILAILGEQVIPAILGETQSGNNKQEMTAITSVEVPNDPSE